MLLVDLSSQESVRRATTALESHGLRVLRSFDLQSALASEPECGCPHHGTSRCTCQYTILLVYGPGRSPTPLALHGRDAETWLTVMPGGESEVRRTISRVLAETFTTHPSQDSHPNTGS